jgi:hypothetical protein
MRACPNCGLKTCTVCGQAKPLSSYHRNAHTRDGRQPRCKACVAIRPKLGPRSEMITRAQCAQRVSEHFGKGIGEQAIRCARRAGLVSTGPLGGSCPRPLDCFEVAAVVLVAALADSLGVCAAARLVSRNTLWLDVVARAMHDGRDCEVGWEEKDCLVRTLRLSGATLRHLQELVPVEPVRRSVA